jgi:hypothetical protein
MRAFVITGPGRAEVQDVTAPEARPPALAAGRLPARKVLVHPSGRQE